MIESTVAYYKYFSVKKGATTVKLGPSKLE
jgi:hypothetical protein